MLPSLSLSLPVLQVPAWERSLLFLPFPPAFRPCLHRVWKGGGGREFAIYFRPFWADLRSFSARFLWGLVVFWSMPQWGLQGSQTFAREPPMIPPLHSRSTWALFRLRRPLFLSSFPIGTFNVNSDPTSSQPRHPSHFRNALSNKIGKCDWVMAQRSDYWKYRLSF